MTDTSTGGMARSRSEVWCLLFGHKPVGHTVYRLESDTGRALYGDLCERCGRFQPREDGKERFENPMATDVGEVLNP